MRRLLERLRHLAPVAVLLFLGFGFLVAAPQGAAAQGRRLALAGPADISAERPLCESILRSLNAEPFRQAPDGRRADQRFVTWELLAIETIPPGKIYENGSDFHLIETAQVDIFNDGIMRTMYRVTYKEGYNSWEQLIFFMRNEGDPVPKIEASGRQWLEVLPENVIEIEGLVFGKDFFRSGSQREFESAHPAFTNFTGHYFHHYFDRGMKYDRRNPDRWIDLMISEEGRSLSILETGDRVMVLEFRDKAANPICYFALAHEERLLEVVGPASGRELETICLKIASAVNAEIESVLANPGSSRSRVVYFNTQAELLRDSSLFLRWQPAYHAPVYQGAPSPFHFGSGRTGNQIGPYENETIEMIEATILNDGIMRRVFRYTESTVLSYFDIFSQHLIFQADNPEGIAGAPPGETVWWFRHFAGRGIYRDVDAHFFGPKGASGFERVDYDTLFAQFPPHATPLGQEFQTGFDLYSFGVILGYGLKEFDLIGLEDGRVLVLLERRRFNASELPMILVLELRPDRAIPVCYLG
jgi:hypothetical protein